MRKEQTRKPPSKGNIAKALTYGWATKRIDKAIAEGFFLEAIAIEESIIADRIWSHVHGALGGKREWKTRETTVGALLGPWKKHNPPAQLVAAVKTWWGMRNEAVHGVAKSLATTGTQQAGVFLKDAERAARSGRTLMRRVMTWHKRALAAHRKAQKRAG